MQPEVARQFEVLWESDDSPPDVFAFLRQHSESDISEKLAIVLRDQRHRWQTSDPLKVEDYLARMPDLADCPEGTMKLAVGEFQARQNCDTSPDIDEFTTRFADIRDSLRSRLVALASVSDLTTDGTDFIASKTRKRPPDLTETLRTESVVSDSGGERYRIERMLGEGAYGRVYLAFDQELRRQVAIKVPTAKRFKRSADKEIYLTEARTVASLDHPGIVPVYDVGHMPDGMIYVVSKFIEGRTLTKRIREDRPTYDQSARLLAGVARGLHHAHQRRIVHRDVKPGNILLEDSTGSAYIADFGLAIREEDYLLDSHVAGTPAYMSPEQARGEGHRLDGRSDIYSLGVVLYELLTGKRPFRGSTSNELLHQVVSVDPPDPREVDEAIPPELERICMKAMSKRASDRYGNASEFADELISWQQESVTQSHEQPIVPKGLRSFDADDADFFLDLLPGPRSRDGLPEDIRFWKTRIEDTDPEKTFCIGLIYGPSGCGKSSLVKAGLLPRLSKEVTAIYLESTPNDTETRILRGLRKRVPELPRSLGLVETFSWLRRRERRKIVVVLDQFEQWLHTHRAEQDAELISALRQCDGGHLQSVVMIRDDFSMAASRFMRELETPIVEGNNFATVDLFDVAHAAKVLTKFGQAFGKLPRQSKEISESQQKFVDAVAAGLAKDGKVVSVRLALFAEMVKGKDWLPASLEEVGGTDGIGANFMEEMFGRQNSNPDHLHHEKAARQVLMALLPEVGSDIKGHMRSHSELLEASQYQARGGEFNALLRILDGKLRLITPTDPKGLDTESASDRDLKFYQLTHDYLVPSLREWLTRKQKESRRGRAELMLAERTSLWNAKPETRHLPSSMEWARISALTDKAQWTQPQRAMMRTAGRVHGARVTGWLALMVVASLLGLSLRNRVLEGNNEERAAGFVTSVTNAEITQIPGLMKEFREDRRWVDPKLAAALAKHDADSSQRLNISLALLPSDPGQIDYLTDRLLRAEPEQVETIRLLIADHKQMLLPKLWRAARQPDEKNCLLQVTSALAVYDPENDAEWEAVSQRVVDRLVNENSSHLAIWIRTLKPARHHLIKPLGVVFRDKATTRPQKQVDRATDILEEYAIDDFDTLAELVLDSEPMQFVALFDEFAAFGGQARSRIESELQRSLIPHWNDEPLESGRQTPSDELTESIELAHGIVAPHFAFCQTMPMSEFSGVNQALSDIGYRPIRFRPYNVRGSIQVAAVWQRDKHDWQLASEESMQAILEEDHRLRENGFVPIDVAGYLDDSNGTTSERFAAVWVREHENELRNARIFVGIRFQEFKEQRAAWKRDGFQFVCALQGFRGQDGRRKFSGVVNEVESASTLFLSQAAETIDANQYYDKIFWDLDSGASMDAGELVTRYAAVWNNSAWLESRESHGLSPKGHLAECRKMRADGYRIAAISVSSLHGDLVTSSVWHRPLIKGADRESLTRRQANAAVAAMRLGRAEQVWPLLDQSSDPRLQSWIIHRLSPMGASPEMIVTRLREEANDTIRRVLILMLGEYPYKTLDSRDSITAELLRMYRENPDPGVHAASEWVLRRWDPDLDLQQGENAYSNQQRDETQRWYRTIQGHTLVVVEGPMAFLMGSPFTERDRSSFEYLHRRQINRSFAIANKEVTVKQFQEFLRDTSFSKHRFSRKHTPDDRCPQTSVTWYEAAAYCRWLSEQDKTITEDQMCYPPIHEIKEGMTLPSDYLTRTGYRLPTEAEWEYACRAGTSTSRYYGEAMGLLGQYAWCVNNSDDRTWPVGMLKPNPIGLFDMQGNVQEWCQERYEDYGPRLGTVTEDREVDLKINDSTRRILRGGSFGVRASDVRSAYRSFNRPPNRYNNSGFRIARTYESK